MGSFRTTIRSFQSQLIFYMTHVNRFYSYQSILLHKKLLKQNINSERDVRIIIQFLLSCNKHPFCRIRQIRSKNTRRHIVKHYNIYANFTLMHDMGDKNGYQNKLKCQLTVLFHCICSMVYRENLLSPSCVFKNHNRYLFSTVGMPRVRISTS